MPPDPQQRVSSAAIQFNFVIYKPMKRFGLSALVIVSFLFYAAHRQTEGSSALGGVASQLPLTTPPAGQNPTPVGRTYKDGTYTGDPADAYYGNVQVKATVAGGKVTEVQFLDYPHDRRTSQMINMMATPLLRSEAIQTQTAQVDIISGATQTSQAFIASLGSALSQAQ